MRSRRGSTEPAACLSVRTEVAQSLIDATFWNELDPGKCEVTFADFTPSGPFRLRPETPRDDPAYQCWTSGHGSGQPRDKLDTPMLSTFAPSQARRWPRRANVDRELSSRRAPAVNHADFRHARPGTDVSRRRWHLQRVRCVALVSTVLHGTGAAANHVINH